MVIIRLQVYCFIFEYAFQKGKKTTFAHLFNEKTLKNGSFEAFLWGVFSFEACPKRR